MARRAATAAAEPPRRRKPSTQDVQAATEGVAIDGDVVGADGKVEFMGAWFKMADSIGLMPLLQFAHASKQGIDSTDMEGLVALYAMIRDCIDQTRPQKEVDGKLVDDGLSEWDRFQRLAIDTKADGEDLMAVVQKCIEAISARPTRRPSGSSAGRPAISGSLRDPSLTEGMVSPENLGR